MRDGVTLMGQTKGQALLLLCSGPKPQPQIKIICTTLTTRMPARESLHEKGRHVGPLITTPQPPLKVSRPTSIYRDESRGTDRDATGRGWSGLTELGLNCLATRGWPAGLRTAVHGAVTKQSWAG